MILHSNLPKLREFAGRSTRVLDVGGWYQPFNLATHVIDLHPYESRRGHAAVDPEDDERFSADTWIVHDVCNSPWPFPDETFDFVVCSNLLEDVRDPITVCSELCRVGKAGYIETPSRVREIFSKEKLFFAKYLLGNVPEIGFHHHRWFVEIKGTHLRFTAKTAALSANRRHYITRADIGRKLTEQESGLGFFWRGGFTVAEVFVDQGIDYSAFRRKAIARLKR